MFCHLSYNDGLDRWSTCGVMLVRVPLPVRAGVQPIDAGREAAQRERRAGYLYSVDFVFNTVLLFVIILKFFQYCLNNLKVLFHKFNFF